MPADALELQRLQAREKVLEALVENLKAQRFVPGLWRCPECDFQLVSNVISVASGQVGASLKRAEPCPNDGSAMMRVTWKERGDDAIASANEQAERAHAAEQVIKAAIAGSEADFRIALAAYPLKFRTNLAGQVGEFNYQTRLPDTPRQCPQCGLGEGLLRLPGEMKPNEETLWACNRCGCKLTECTVLLAEHGARAVLYALKGEIVSPMRLFHITRFLVATFLGMTTTPEPTALPVPQVEADTCDTCGQSLMAFACGPGHAVRRRDAGLEWNGLSPVRDFTHTEDV